MILWLAKRLGTPGTVTIVPAPLGDERADVSQSGLEAWIRQAHRPAEWAVFKIEVPSGNANVVRVWNREMDNRWALLTYRVNVAPSGRLTRGAVELRKGERPDETPDEDPDGLT